MSEPITFRQRKKNTHFLKDLLGTSIVEVRISDQNLTIKTIKETNILTWPEIMEAIIIKEVIKSGFPETLSIGLKYLILKTATKDFKIDISNECSEIEDASDFLIELIKYKKITGWGKME